LSFQYLLIFAFNRLMTRLALSPNGPQTAPFPARSRVANEHKPGNQRRDQRSGKFSEHRFEAQPNIDTILAFVFLILIELGGMVVLCYKCERPAAVSIFRDR
jgi:hypothetical protein